mmetsp:Transcript_50431/g.132832  ORF Transcript_50431/g.132832 Transcript_50431/m.132832 type:complete len:213 (+) Transcript_50431:309-947(+)
MCQRRIAGPWCQSSCRGTRGTRPVSANKRLRRRKWHGGSGDTAQGHTRYTDRGTPAPAPRTTPSQPPPTKCSSRGRGEAWGIRGRGGGSWECSRGTQNMVALPTGTTRGHHFLQLPRRRFLRRDHAPAICSLKSRRPTSPRQRGLAQNELHESGHLRVSHRSPTPQRTPHTDAPHRPRPGPPWAPGSKGPCQKMQPGYPGPPATAGRLGSTR